MKRGGARYRERRGRTLEYAALPCAGSLAAGDFYFLFFGGEAGTGGSTKEATTGIWKPFFATLSRLTLLLATRAAFCQLFLTLSSARSTPFRNIN